MAVAYSQQSGITQQGNGLSTIQPGFGLSFPDNNDLMLLIACTSGAVGYTLEGSGGYQELIKWEHDPGPNLSLAIWWCLFGDRGGLPTIDVESFTQKTEFCMEMVLTGVDPDDPIDVIGTRSQTSSDETDIGPISGITPTNPGAGILCVGIRRDGFSSDIDTLSGDVTWDELVDHPHIGLGDHSLALAIDFAADADGPTAVADKTFTQTDGNDATWMGVMFSINPLITFTRDPVQGWPRGDLILPPAGPAQGWPRGTLPNFANTPGAPADDRQAAILDTSPIAYWPMREDFTEKVGGAAPDLTPHGSPGFAGGAVDLNGTSQYMVAEDFNPYAGASILTFLVFIARDGTGSYQAILGSYISSYDFYFNSGSSQLVCGDHGSGAQKFLTNTEDYIGSSVQPLFIEISDTGDVVTAWAGTTPDGSNGFPIDFTTVAESDLAIGLDIGDSNPSAGSYFPGLMSDVAIWDRALTGGERSAIVAATL